MDFYLQDVGRSGDRENWPKIKSVQNGPLIYIPCLVWHSFIHLNIPWGISSVPKWDFSKKKIGTNWENLLLLVKSNLPEEKKKIVKDEER